MMMFVFLFLVGVVCVKGCMWLSRGAADMFFPEQKEDRNSFVDRSVHHHTHYHDNRVVNVDEETFKKSLGK